MEIRRSHPLASISKASANGENPRDGHLRKDRESWRQGGRCLGEREIERSQDVSLCAPVSAFLPFTSALFRPDAGFLLRSKPSQC